MRVKTFTAGLANEVEAAFAVLDEQANQVLFHPTIEVVKIEDKIHDAHIVNNVTVRSAIVTRILVYRHK